jgi:hypothetical protein
LAARIERHLIYCACGCGTKIWNVDDKGQPRKYAPGHSTRGRKLNVDRRGERAPGWKGGRYKTKNGYILVHEPDHPQVNANGYVPEHRLVYEESRLVCILPWVDVHHKDGNKTNNIWYNLILVSESEHMKIHNPRQDFGALCRCGSKNVIRYGVCNNSQRFLCKNCNEDWYIPLLELQIMIKEYSTGLRDAIKSPRIDAEPLKLEIPIA